MLSLFCLKLLRQCTSNLNGIGALLQPDDPAALQGPNIRPSASKVADPASLGPVATSRRDRAAIRRRFEKVTTLVVQRRRVEGIGQRVVLRREVGGIEVERIDYRRLGVPTSLNAASVRVEVVEDPFPEGPYGAKGISETATVPSTPAILNAIYNATGVRVSEIPVDSKRLAEAMAGQTPARVAPRATAFEQSRTPSSAAGRSGPWQELEIKA